MALADLNEEELILLWKHRDPGGSKKFLELMGSLNRALDIAREMKGNNRRQPPEFFPLARKIWFETGAMLDWMEENPGTLTAPEPPAPEGEIDPDANVRYELADPPEEDA